MKIHAYFKNLFKNGKRKNKLFFFIFVYLLSPMNDLFCQDTLIIPVDDFFDIKVLEDRFDDDRLYEIKKEDGTWFIIGEKKDLIELSNTISKNAGTAKPTTVTPKESRGFEILTDQDVLSSTNMDRDYTMGFRMGWYGNHTNKNIYILPLLRKLTDIGPSYFLRKKAIENKPHLSSYSMDFAESAFTPYELRFNFVDSTDRPYAAILHFNSSAYHEYLTAEVDSIKRYFGKDSSFSLSYKSFGYRSKFTFGLVGRTPSTIARWAQTAIHAANRRVNNASREDPEGWHLAIGGDKNHLVINYDFAYSWNIVGEFPKIRIRTKNELPIFKKSKFLKTTIPKVEVLPPLKFLLQPYVGSSVGALYNNVNAGIDFEVGFFKKPYNRLANTNYNKVYDVNELYAEGLEISFIFSGQLNAWLHNTLLQGTLLKDSSPYKIEPSGLKRITDFSLIGGKISFHSVTIGYLVARRSPVIEISERLHGFHRIFLRIDL